MACKCIGIHPDTVALDLLFQDAAAPVDASVAKPVYQAPESHKPIMNIAERANMQVWLQADLQTAVPLSQCSKLAHGHGVLAASLVAQDMSVWGILKSTWASMAFWKKNRVHASGSQSKRTLVRSPRIIVSQEA